MRAVEKLIETARDRPAHVVLPEGADERIIVGALRAVREKIAAITLLGETRELEAALEWAGGKPGEIAVIDPASSGFVPAFAEDYLEIRKARLSSPEDAAAAVRDPLVFAAMMVRRGHADGTLAGAIHTTTETVRVAIQVIGPAAGTEVISSFFLMGLGTQRRGEAEAVLFSDCGLVVDPDSAQLAEIALATARSYRAMTGQTPRVGMLSFSTKGSARHHAVSKVSEATRLAKAQAPDLMIDGELQFDAAFLPDVATKKAPESAIAGRVNCFIFPNLDAGNIGYKIAQRLGGAMALGPVLQGLAKPANDLSRGCDADDVFHMIAVTVNQARLSRAG